MTDHHTFRTCVVLTAVLTLSMPFVALSENTVYLGARTAAQRDVNNDFDKGLWYAAGAAPVIGTVVGTFTGCYLGSIIFPSDNLSYFFPSDGEIIGASVGCVVLGLVPFMIISNSITNYQPTNLPADRLIGKTPEYVEFYTEFYKQKTKALRKSSALMGGSVATGIGLLVPVAISYLTQ